MMNLLMSEPVLLFVAVATSFQTTAADRQLSVSLSIDDSLNVSDWFGNGRAYRWKRASLTTGDKWQSAVEKQLNDMRRTVGAANMYYAVNLVINRTNTLISAYTGVEVIINISSCSSQLLSKFCFHSM
jgi:hypothetical protein